MVAEIACRMFTDLTLRGSVRWQAIQAFTGYLELYWESLRTPKNRATYLKQSEGKLLEAVAEDETFDLAFYNLGVVYSQLAQAEFFAVAAAEYPERKATDPAAAHAARIEAARAAFTRAISLNLARWEAVYALAVHEFSAYQQRKWKAANGDAVRRRHELRSILRRCERVLELERWNPQAYDLMGMAQLELGVLGGELELMDAAVRNHGRAVTRSWTRLCRAEYRERRTPPTGESVRPGARANAAAALHNLAHARWERARRSPVVRRRLRMARADRVFHEALLLAPSTARAAMQFERGRVRDADQRRDAVASYCAAVRMEPENPVYWAYLARAQARNKLCDDALQSCAATLNALAPIYRRSLEPFAFDSTTAARDSAVKALGQAYRCLGRKEECQRAGHLLRLASQIGHAQDTGNVHTLKRRLRTCPGGDWWEREQIGLALARTLGDKGDWNGAATEYQWLIEKLATYRPDAIRQHALHAKRAKALRRDDNKQEALASAARGLLLDPINAVARRELGKAHLALLQYEEALEAWQHTLWLTPNDATLHWKAAFSLWSVAQDRHDADERRQALSEAAAGFEQAAMLFGIENVEGWAWSRLWLGRTCAELEQADLAVKHLRAAKGCGVSELAARLLLAEVYQRIGQGGLALDQFVKARERLRQAVVAEWRRQPASEVLARRCDADWGETLPYGEILARVHLGLGRHAFEVEGDEESALRHASRAERLIGRLEDRPCAQNRLRAYALELRSRIHFAREDLTPALEAIQRATRLCPEPDLLLHELDVASTCLDANVRSQARAQLIAGMVRDLGAIRRTEGNAGDRVRRGTLIVRQWIPDEAGSVNGAVASRGGPTASSAPQRLTVAAGTSPANGR